MSEKGEGVLTPATRPPLDPPLIRQHQLIEYVITTRTDTGVGSGGGVCRGSDTPNYLCGGDIDMYIPLEKPNT